MAAPPSARERAHFAAVARAMAEEKRDQIARAARETTADGITVGLEMAALAADRPEIAALELERAAGQVELRRRWRRLQAKAG
jgi:hypothetical protein